MFKIIDKIAAICSRTRRDRDPCKHNNFSIIIILLFLFEKKTKDDSTYGI